MLRAADDDDRERLGLGNAFSKLSNIHSQRSLLLRADHGFASWQLPDRIELIETVPRSSVGKFDKKALRARFAA